MSEVAKFNLFGEDVYLKDETARTQSETNAQNIIKSNGNAGRKYLFIGDSYGTDKRVTPWTETFASLANLTPDRYFNYCQGAIGWLDVGTKVFNDRLNDAFRNIQNPDEITDIIVVGGFFADMNSVGNDPANLKSNLTAAFSTFSNNAKTKFKNATLYYGFPSVTLNTAVISAGLTYQQIINSYTPVYRLIVNYGFVWLDNIDTTLMRNNYIDTSESAALHPSGAGGKALGAAIYCAINSSYSSYNSTNISLNTSGTANQSASCRIRIFSQNYHTELTLRDTVLLSVAGVGEYVIGVIGSTKAVNSFTNVIFVASGIYQDGGVTKPCCVPIIGDGNELKAQVNFNFTGTITLYACTCVASTKDIFVKL